ncbi:amino acid ABC transporter permease, partial [Enterococcus faecalis]
MPHDIIIELPTVGIVIIFLVLDSSLFYVLRFSVLFRAGFFALSRDLSLVPFPLVRLFDLLF